jgi:hypothetical protein
MYVNVKIIPVETVSGIKGGDESSGAGELKYDIVDTLYERS